MRSNILGAGVGRHWAVSMAIYVEGWSWGLNNGKARWMPDGAKEFALWICGFNTLQAV